MVLTALSVVPAMLILIEESASTLPQELLVNHPIPYTLAVVVALPTNIADEAEMVVPAGVEMGMTPTVRHLPPALTAPAVAVAGVPREMPLPVVMVLLSYGGNLKWPSMII